MKTLVFGKNGQVAQELSRIKDVVCVGRDQADLTNPAQCQALIDDGNFEAVINAAAYTAVDKAEEEEALATVINSDAPTAMAQSCAARSIPFVHISTDYVFDGTGTQSWKATDRTDPQNAYGRSKRKGEEGIEASGANYAILRTSWVVSAHGHNFVKTMLRLGNERDALSIVSDQIGGPTAARDIAKACHQIAQSLQKDAIKSGVYHFSGAPDVSWAEFAREIFNQAQIECDVNDIPSSEFPTPAKRPLNSRLDCSTTFETFGIKRPDWRESLKEILEDLS